MSDEHTTAETQPLEPPGEGGGGGPKRLLRSRDRMLAGVAGGIGKYFNIDPNIVRIGFALSIMFGGLGVVVYIVLGLVLPEEGERPGEVEPPVIQRSRALAIAAGVTASAFILSWGFVGFDPWPFDRGGGWFFGGPLLLLLLLGGAYLVVRGASRGSNLGWLGAIIFGTAVFIGLSIAVAIAFWAAATGQGVVVATILIAIGVMLVVAAFNGGARWLIAPAVALALPLGFVAATDVSFGSGFGERHYRPASIDAIPDDGRYELGIGHLMVDLRRIDWQPGDVVELDVDLGMGQATVAVPENLCVVTDIEAKMGAIDAAGDNAAGFDAGHELNDGADVTPRLELHGEVDLGQFRLINDDFVAVDDPRPWRHRGLNESEARVALEDACTPERAEDQRSELERPGAKRR